MGFLLWLIAIVLKNTVGVIGFAYSIIRSLFKGEIFWYFYELSLAWDHFGNVLLQYPLNDLIGEGFGNIKESISSRTGKCERDKKLKVAGPDFVRVLNTIDKNHCKDAIDEIV